MLPDSITAARVLRRARLSSLYTAMTELRSAPVVYGAFLILALLAWALAVSWPLPCAISVRSASFVCGCSSGRLRNRTPWGNELHFLKKGTGTGSILPGDSGFDAAGRSQSPF